jgi:gliding motility-associated-like protein
MNKTDRSKNSFLTAAILMATGLISFSQTTLFNNGALVYTASSAIVKVNGTFQNDGAAGTSPIFENNGTMTISNSGTPGSVILSNGSSLQGNGTYYVEQDWINNAVFNAGTSTVILDGNLQQFVTSTTGVVTTFNNLTLTGNGVGNNRKKTLSTVNAIISPTGTLNLNDREFETLSNTIFVTNPSPAAVLNSTTFNNEGYVSSDIGGSLSRETNSSSIYLFPTGSSNGTQRYRAVEINPASNSANTFTARLGNNNATADGFNVSLLDATMCKVTGLFYHQINRTAGTDNAGIDIFYDQAADGLWDGLAQWNTPNASLWNNLGTVTQTTSSTYNDNLKVNWSDFSNSPYILSRSKLAVPVFACKDVCSNSTGNIFTATGAPSGSTYVWNTPTGTTISSGQGTNSIGVDWGTTSGPIVVMDTNSVGCFSDPVSCTVNVLPVPNVAFTSAGSDYTFNFSNLSTGTVTSWAWDFGDGASSSLQNPEHTYADNGSQTVCLTASNNGCEDSECKVVEVDATDFINIPNVFTPDGDGVNDYFFINSSRLKTFKLDIYDRWGLLVFSSEHSGEKWDGRTTSGVKASDGTYYFVLKATSMKSKDYSTTGFVTLLGSK